MPDFNAFSTILPNVNNGWNVPPSVRSRLLSDTLIQQQAATPTPIYHVGAGIAKMAGGAIGGLMEGMELRREEAAQAQARAEQGALLMALIRQRGGMGGSMGAAQAGPSSPQPGQNGNIGAPVTFAAPDQKTADGAGDHEAFIRAYAASKGIDPDVAVKVARSEGLGAGLGDGGSSGGDFQLHVGGIAPGGNAVPGLGDDFRKATGLDPLDPKNWQAADKFALDNAAQNGWGAFHGAARTGIGPMAGIGQPQGQVAGDNAAPQPGYMPSVQPDAHPSPLAAALMERDPGAGPVQTPGPTGAAADYMLNPATGPSNPPSAAAGGLGAAPASATLPGADTPLPGDIPATANMVPPNAIPNAPPDADSARPANPPLPPPGVQSLTAGDAENPAQNIPGNIPATPAPDATAFAPASPMASAPAQRAIAAAVSPGSPDAASSPLAAALMGGAPVESPAMAKASGPSPLAMALMQSQGGSPGSPGPGAHPELAQALAPQPSPSPTPAPQQSGQGGFLDSLFGGGSQPQPPAPSAGQPQDLASAYARVAADPRTPPQFLAQAAQMMMPSYSFEKLPDGTVLRIDQRSGQVAPAYHGSVPLKANESLANPQGIAIQAPSGPQTVGPGSSLVTFGPNNQPAQAMQNPATPKWVPQPNGQMVNETSPNGQGAPTPGGMALPGSIEAGGAKVPTLTTGSPQSPQTSVLAPQGGPPGQGPLGAVAPLAQQAGQLNAQAAGQKKEAEGQVDDLGKMAQAGVEARDMVNQLQELRALSGKVGSGYGPMLQKWLGDHGVVTKSSSDIDAMEGLQGYLATRYRQAGSGPLRNLEMERFASNLGGLRQTPEVRDQTFQRGIDLFSRAAQMGDIAANGQVAPQDRINQIHALAAQPYGPQGGQGQPARIQSADDYNALPSGAQFIDPQGNLRTKR